MSGNSTKVWGLALAGVLLAACNDPYDFNRDGTADFAWVDHTGEYWRVGEDEPFWSPQETAGAPDFLPAPGRFGERSVWDPGVLTPHGWESEYSGLYADYPDDVPYTHPVARDYTGDGTMERALWDLATATWYIEGHDPVTYGLVYAGDCEPISDVPTPGDFNGDGTATLAVFRPTDQRFHFADGTTSDPFPLGVPLVADFDGDGTDQVAVFSLLTTTWHFVDGTSAPVAASGALFPAPADHDGDGAADLVVFDYDSGRWLATDGTVLAEDSRAEGNFPATIPSALPWDILRITFLEVTADEGFFDDDFGHC